MKALKQRFNGNCGEVVNYAREFGIMAAMEQYEVRDYIAMLNFLKEQAPDVEFRATQVADNDFTGPDAFDKLVEAMFRKYSKMEASNQTLATENAELKSMVQKYRRRRQQEVNPLVTCLLEYCNQENDHV
jgi:hypothetical protein